MYSIVGADSFVTYLFGQLMVFSFTSISVEVLHCVKKAFGHQGWWSVKFIVCLMRKYVHVDVQFEYE
jgi:hypothetical protein